MATAREKRITEMRESMERLEKEYDIKKPAAKKKAKRKTKTRKEDGTKAPFSVFGLAGKIRRRKARNIKAAKAAK